MKDWANFLNFHFFQTRFLFLNPLIFLPDSSGHSILEHPLKVKSQAWYGEFQRQTWLQSLETIELISSQRKAAYTHKEKPHPNETCIKYQMGGTGPQCALQKGVGRASPLCWHCFALLVLPSDHSLSAILQQDLLSLLLNVEMLWRLAQAHTALFLFAKWSENNLSSHHLSEWINKNGVSIQKRTTWQ